MLDRLLTGVRTVVRREGRTDRSPTSPSNVEGLETPGPDTGGWGADEKDTGERDTGGRDTGEKDTDGGAGRFYVCEGCDTTFISEAMAECSKCGAAVHAERRDALKRDSFV